MVVFKNSNIEILYLPEKKQIIQIWKSYISSSDFREAIDSTVEFVGKNDVDSIISDTTLQNAIKPEDSEYAANVLPLLFKNIKLMAFVLPKDIFTKMALKKFSNIKKNNKVQYFNEIEEAKLWIETALTDLY